MRMREHHYSLTFALAQSFGRLKYMEFAGYLDKTARATVGAWRPPNVLRCASEVSTPMAGTGSVARHVRGELRRHKVLSLLHYTATGARAHIKYSALVAA